PAARRAGRGDPFGQDWDERNVFLRRNAREDVRVPDGNIREVVLTAMAVYVFDVDNAAAVERYVSAVTRLAQRKRNIVPIPKMLGDQMLQIDVRQKIAAVDDERVGPQVMFDVLDAATRSEDRGLVDQADAAALIGAAREELL